MQTPTGQRACEGSAKEGLGLSTSGSAMKTKTKKAALNEGKNVRVDELNEMESF